ncbi:hypothetical protein AAL_06649 [Moelleriella libera RCEF 2490]|uniref:DUF2470 domain-containing protein n=1 Tax=Moelleriella libera RCEF 2490 TaxID=1081109 RepID=A0A162ICB7_9HYPO|nr:hypothetical protein AAL_06649 [Moelleriella libera RCEF 2490]
MAVTGDDAAQRDRIISHMNQQHSRELTFYLRHYQGLSIAQAAGASLRDVTLKEMRIRAQGTDYTIPFNPPLSSWSEVRGRVVAMDATARAGLGISDILMDRYYGPGFFDKCLMGLVVFYFFCLFSLPWFVPGTRAWKFVSTYLPFTPEFWRWEIKFVFWPTQIVHLAENFYLDYSRLGKHGIDRWSPVWWQWIVSNYFEGIMAYRRFDRVIAAKRAEKEAKKD